MRLRVEGLSAWYGDARAIWNVSFEVPEGKVVGVLGRNGAGKTTLLRSLVGLQQRVEGAVIAGEERLDGKTPNVIALRGISLLREGGRLPGSLSVLENLALGRRLAALRGKKGLSLEEIWRLFPILEPLRERKAALLSGGQRQALALASAFISEPSIMLLDEPSAGLAPPVAKEVFSTIAQLASRGVTILVVEQSPSWLSGIASRAYLIEVGCIVAEGDLDELIEKADAAML